MKKIWILGGSGMLGQACGEVLSDFEFETLSISRTKIVNIQKESQINFALNLEKFRESFLDLAGNYGPPNYFINCIGVVKPRIKEDVGSISNAYRINSIFPRELDELAQDFSSTVLQIGTDCVFSGSVGGYLEDDSHNAEDHYGISKSLGEVQTETTKIIRSSIIGLEKENMYSLVSWVKNQNYNSHVNGFLNHNWNGVTTKTFALILKGIIKNDLQLNEKQHLIPANHLNKYALVVAIAKSLGRKDLIITETNASESVNRTLSTLHPHINEKLWELGGFREIPTVENLVENYLL